MFFQYSSLFFEKKKKGKSVLPFGLEEFLILDNYFILIEVKSLNLA